MWGLGKDAPWKLAYHAGEAGDYGGWLASCFIPEIMKKSVQKYSEWKELRRYDYI